MKINKNRLPVVIHKSVSDSNEARSKKRQIHILMAGVLILIASVVVTVIIIHRDNENGDLWLASRIHQIYLRTHFNPKLMTSDEKTLAWRFKERAEQIMEHCYHVSAGKKPCTMTGKKVIVDTPGGILTLQYPPCTKDSGEKAVTPSYSGLDAIQWPCSMTAG